MPFKGIEERRAYYREWMAKRRAEYFAGKECFRCGSKVDLNIHHVKRRDKKTHNIWSWREKRRLEELEKCIVLCLSCHKLEHGCNPNPHGTLMGYNVRGCRCALCVEARREYDRAYRKKKRLKRNSLPEQPLFPSSTRSSSDPLE